MDCWKNNEGFTLIEVLIAIAIFSIGILSVASLQTDAIMKTISARNTTEALKLANAQAEFLQGLPLYDDSFDMPDELTEDGGFEMGRYTIQWTVTDDEPLPAIPNVFSSAGGNLTITKTIMVNVAETRRPNQPLATIEMVKVWDRDG